MSPMQPKVTVGGTAAGASGSISIIAVWLIGHFFGNVPPEIAAAMAALVAAGCSMLAGYLQSHLPPPAA